MAPRVPIANLIDTSTFGTDGRPGLQYRRIRGARVALEWCVRRWLVPRDGLPWAFGVGLDLPGYINATPSPGDLQKLKMALDSEGARSEYVVSIESTIDLAASGLLTYAPLIKLIGAGVYPLVVSIDSAAEILIQFPIL